MELTFTYSMIVNMFIIKMKLLNDNILVDTNIWCMYVFCMFFWGKIYMNLLSLKMVFKMLWHSEWIYCCKRIFVGNKFWIFASLRKFYLVLTKRIYFVTGWANRPVLKKLNYCWFEWGYLAMVFLRQEGEFQGHFMFSCAKLLFFSLNRCLLAR